MFFFPLAVLIIYVWSSLSFGLDEAEEIFFVNRMLHFFSLLKGSRPVPWFSVKILMAVTWN